MIADPLFWAAALPAVLVFGISKGGFGTGLGILAVPLMALAIPPAQAAAIMLPTLLVMDFASVWAWWGRGDRALLRLLLPAGLLGTAIGTLAFRTVSAAHLKLALGAIAVWFVLIRVLARPSRREKAPPSRPKGAFWATVSGLTSFIAHAGGPPMSIYLLPLRLEPAVLMGVTSVFFAAMNWAKVLPYGWLGLYSAENLVTAAALAPVGLAGVGLGVWLHRRVDPALFYRLAYAFLLVTGTKLLYDGLRA